MTLSNDHSAPDELPSSSQILEHLAAVRGALSAARQRCGSTDVRMAYAVMAGRSPLPEDIELEREIALAERIERGLVRLAESRRERDVDDEITRLVVDRDALRREIPALDQRIKDIRAGKVELPQCTRGPGWMYEPMEKAVAAAENEIDSRHGRACEIDRVIAEMRRTAPAPHSYTAPSRMVSVAREARDGRSGSR